MGPAGLVMRRRWVGVLVVAALVCAVVIAAGFRGLLWWTVGSSPINIQLTDVASIQIQPVPEGPPLGPVTPQSQQWTLIETAIPIPLPGPVNQPIGCDQGGDLIVNLRDGRTVTYGPCRHPQAIRALWARLETVESNGRCTEGCAPPE
jgi:hypothetical protein